MVLNPNKVAATAPAVEESSTKLFEKDEGSSEDAGNGESEDKMKLRAEVWFMVRILIEN